MTIVAAHDWRFQEHGDIEKGFSAAGEYLGFLTRDAAGLTFSLWLRARQEPLRAFHIVAFRDLDAWQSAADADATARFVAKLYPEIDEQSHVAPKCDVVLSSGGTLPAVQSGATSLVTVVNQWKFTPDGDVNRGMKAAADYVDYFDREKPQVRLSLWLKNADDPLHHYHVAVFDDADEAQKGIRWDGTERFAASLYPEIDADSVDQPHCDVIASSGAALEPVPWPRREEEQA